MPSAAFLRSFTTRFFIALVAGFVLLSATLWGEDTYADIKIGQMPSHHFRAGVLQDRGDADAPGKAANYLIVGSDSRSFVKTATDATHFGRASTETGSRSDTIMIAHVDPNAKQAFLVSIPRDTAVKIHGGCSEKINAAFNADYSCRGEHGGPPLLVETIKDNFNVDINHYLEVDFVGFRSIIDVLGSVPIYFPTKARDVKTGLSVDGGCQKLTGIMALNYARSRHYQYWDYAKNDWRDDNQNDFGRIRRQQYLIRTMMQDAVNQGAHDILTALDLVDKIVQFVGRDEKFSKDSVKRLLNTFSVTDPGSVPMETLPTGYRSGTLELAQPAAEAMLLRLRTFAPPPPKITTTVPKIKTTDVKVLLRDGSGRVPLGKAASNDLVKLGFQTSTPEAASAIATTEIRYTKANADKAFVVASYLGGVGKFVLVPTLDAGDVEVVLGQDFVKVVDPAKVKPPAKPNKPPVVKPKGPLPNPGTPPPGTNPKTIGAQYIGCRL